MASSRDALDSTGWGSRSKAERSLADLCSEAFLLIFHIRGGNPYSPRLRSAFERLPQPVLSRASRDEAIGSTQSLTANSSSRSSGNSAGK